METPSLYARVEAAVYGPDGLPSLRTALDDLTAATLVEDIDDPESLTLKPDGRMRDGYRYTRTAFRQVANVLARGLAGLVSDVAGELRDPGEDRAVSFQDAVRIFNRILGLRHASLVSRYRVVRNLNTRTIDGLVGSRFLLLQNADLLEKVEELTVEHEPALQFREATLAGRRLVVRYITREPLFTLPGHVAAGPADPIHGGFHFANSEIGGESSLRGAPLLWRAASDTAALGRWFGGGRVTHAGKSFDRRTFAIFADASRSHQDPRRLRDQVANLHRRELGLTSDDEEREDRIKALVAALVERDVPKTEARKAVLSAIYVGAYGEERALLTPPSGATLAGRTEFDLFVALGAETRYAHAATRDAAERAAYDLLVGRLVLPAPPERSETR